MKCKDCVYCLKDFNLEWHEGDKEEPFCALKSLFTLVEPEDECDEKDANQKYYFTKRETK